MQRSNLEVGLMALDRPLLDRMWVGLVWEEPHQAVWIFHYQLFELVELVILGQELLYFGEVIWKEPRQASQLVLISRLQQLSQPPQFFRLRLFSLLLLFFQLFFQ